MKKLSNHLLADTIVSARKQKKLSQQALANLTGMNRSVLSKLEAEEYTPSIAQLEELARVLNFDITDMFQESSNISLEKVSPLKIAVAGTGASM